MPKLSEHQFNTLAVLMRDPDKNYLVWTGAGNSGFGCGDEPFHRERPENRELILSVPEKYRWPYRQTLWSLNAKGCIEMTRGECGFISYWQITTRGRAVYMSDPALDAELITP